MKSHDSNLQGLRAIYQAEPSERLQKRVVESAMSGAAEAVQPFKRRMSMRTGLISATLALLMLVTTAFAFSEQIIGVFQTRDLMSAYDADGNLIWRQTLDENGKLIYVDYEAEPFEGDVRIKGFEDVLSHNILDIPCVDGVYIKHIVNNGLMAVYANDGDQWSLRSGQSVNITFDVTDEDWWGVWIGYCKDGEYILYGYDPDLEIDQRYILSGETAIEIVVPEDGEYTFFMVNMSAGDILVNSCTITH